MLLAPGLHAWFYRRLPVASAAAGDMLALSRLRCRCRNMRLSLCHVRLPRRHAPTKRHVIALRVADMSAHASTAVSGYGACSL